jgi:hypothetical protein
MLELLEQGGGLFLSENLFPKHQGGDGLAAATQFEDVEGDNWGGDTE